MGGIAATLTRPPNKKNTAMKTQVIFNGSNHGIRIVTRNQSGRIVGYKYTTSTSDMLAYCQEIGVRDPEVITR